MPPSVAFTVEVAASPLEAPSKVKGVALAVTVNAVTAVPDCPAARRRMGRRTRRVFMAGIFDGLGGLISRGLGGEAGECFVGDDVVVG